jgi:cation diffusion facilitator CzcD-associated flavoprotein CzcO
VTSVSSPRVAIVGAGFAGIGMAISLQRAGFTNFEVLERGDRVGGVWRENTYPGAGCDIPSPFYSFSFAPNPRWPYRYSKQDSILDYLERCVDTFGIRDRIRLDTEVTGAEWQDAEHVWSVEFDGATHSFDALVCACGQLSEPTTPNFPGSETFTGHSFHSAQWDHEYDLAGKRVAVVGTGASAIQFVPEIASEVAELHLFQRSAPYVLPKPDRRYSGLRQRMFERVPALLSAERLGWFTLCEYGQVALSEHPGWLGWVASLGRWHLKHVIKDPAKRAALEPTDHPGCKRLLFSNYYYQALARPNVEIIPEGVASISSTAVTSSSGLTREVDAIIYATGFAAQGFVAPMAITGREGRALEADAWSTGASAYLGITVPDFPNMFLLYGPNTNLGTGSIVHMIESAVHYVTEAISAIQRQPSAAFSVRRGRAHLYDDEIQRRLSGSAWASGCSSWYVDDNGRNANNWPGTMSEYRWRTHQFKLEDFEALEDEAPLSAMKEAVQR